MTSQAHKQELMTLRRQRKVDQMAAKRHSMTCRVSDYKRWSVWCSCSWHTPLWAGDTPRTFATEAEAVRACIGHYRNVSRW